MTEIGGTLHRAASSPSCQNPRSGAPPESHGGAEGSPRQCVRWPFAMPARAPAYRRKSTTNKGHARRRGCECACPKPAQWVSLQVVMVEQYGIEPKLLLVPLYSIAEVYVRTVDITFIATTARHSSINSDVDKNQILRCKHQSPGGKGPPMKKTYIRDVAFFWHACRQPSSLAKLPPLWQEHRRSTCCILLSASNSHQAANTCTGL